MPLRNQLKIVDPEGHLKIYSLDIDKGTVRIGPDPANDICLTSPGVAPVYLELDYRQQPYHLTVLSREDAVTLNKEVVPPESSCEIHDRDVIQVAGYTMTFRAHQEEPPAPDEDPDKDPDEDPDIRPTPEPLPPPEPGPDPRESAIITTISEQAWTLDVEQTIALQLTVINAGEYVADFDVTAEGVPEAWVTISPAHLDLNEREHGTVEVSVTPPRSPTSQAGIHILTLVVTSPIYPKERSLTQVSLTINPYYELAVENLSPGQQSISWSQPWGRTEVPLTNKGNSEVLVQMTGEDEANACSFEFEVQRDELDEPLYRTGQVELPIPLNKGVRVPVRLIPRSRPLIGRGGRLVDRKPRVHSYSITVTMPQSQQMRQTLPGRWGNSPRFSPRVLFVAGLGIILALLALTWAIFQPRIVDLQVSPASIRAGQVVELQWRAWPPFLISYKLNGEPVTLPFTGRPKQTTTYELRADTWLSHLVSAWSEIAQATVEVRPVKPDILLFEVLPEQVTPGETVIMSWVVDDAGELALIDHSTGLQQTLASPSGSREIKVRQDTVHYTLQAIGADGAIVEQPVTVDVTSPVIKAFSVRPGVITTTDTETEVELAWWVTGKADWIRLSGNSVLISEALRHKQDHFVQTVNNTTVFTLSVGSGDTQVVETVRVKHPKSGPTNTPALAPASTPTPPQSSVDPSPDTVLVYTALSDGELGALGATPVTSLTEIPDSFRATPLTFEELQEFDYIITPTNALSTNVLIVRRSTEDLIRQILAEKENPRADVIWGVAATGMIRLGAEGLLEPLAGLYRPQGLEGIKDGWRDPTPPPQWLGLSAWLAAFCVNENKLPEDVIAPKSWQNLLDSKYQDLIAMPNPYTSGTGYMVVSGLLQLHPFGEPAGWDYMDRLHENIRWYTSASCQLAEKAEIAIGIAASSACLLGENEGLNYIYPEEGSGWEMDAVALVRKDVISKDALTFVTWAISKEAMRGYAEFRPVLSHKEFPPEFKVKGQEKCYEGFEPERQMIPNRFWWASANYERIAEKWQSRYGSEPNLIQLDPVSKP